MTDTIDIVRRSQDRFAEILGSLPPDQVSAPSYDDEWSIADVASHLGSQAEIFGLFLEAGIDGTEPPDHDARVSGEHTRSAQNPVSTNHRDTPAGGRNAAASAAGASSARRRQYSSGPAPPGSPSNGPHHRRTANPS